MQFDSTTFALFFSNFFKYIRISLDKKIYTRLLRKISFFLPLFLLQNFPDVSVFSLNLTSQISKDFRFQKMYLRKLFLYLALIHIVVWVVSTPNINIKNLMTLRFLVVSLFKKQYFGPGRFLDYMIIHMDLAVMVLDWDRIKCFYLFTSNDFTIASNRNNNFKSTRNLEECAKYIMKNLNLWYNF